MQIFVTGATGYIGSVLVQKLIRDGHKVIGLSRSEVDVHNKRGGSI